MCGSLSLSIRKTEIDTPATQALALPSIISHRWIVHPCSAYTGTGLDAGLDWVVKEVAGRLYWSGLSVQGTTERIPERLAEGVVT